MSSNKASEDIQEDLQLNNKMEKLKLSDEFEEASKAEE